MSERTTLEEALAADARGHLPLGARQKVWAALGPAGEEGRRARARLAIIATRRVLPIWERAWPQDRLPHRLLELAEKVLAGEARPAQLQAERDRAFTALDDLAYLARDKIPVAVGYAAEHALTAAIEDEAFDPARVDPGALDEDVEPRDHDSSYLASVAAAGGPPWDSSSSVERRREFWRWWLAEAVPEVAG